MLNMEELEAMRNTGITETDPASLIDINTTEIDASLPAAERMERYLAQVRNPYCFLCGSTPVRVCFSPGGQELRAKLINYFTALKKG